MPSFTHCAQSALSGALPFSFSSWNTDVCTVTLTFEIWPLVKIMTHPWVMEHYYVKYHSDPTWQWGAMARTQILGYVCTVTLTLEIWPWVKVMHTSLGNRKHLCKILSRSNLAVRSYGPVIDFGYVWIVTLNLEIWPWVKITTHPWVMDKNCV